MEKRVRAQEKEGEGVRKKRVQEKEKEDENVGKSRVREQGKVAPRAEIIILRHCWSDNNGILYVTTKHIKPYKAPIFSPAFAQPTTSHIHQPVTTVRGFPAIFNSQFLRRGCRLNKPFFHTVSIQLFKKIAAFYTNHIQFDGMMYLQSLCQRLYCRSFT